MRSLYRSSPILIPAAHSFFIAATIRISPIRTDVVIVIRVIAYAGKVVVDLENAPPITPICATTINRNIVRLIEFLSARGRETPTFRRGTGERDLSETIILTRSRDTGSFVRRIVGKFRVRRFSIVVSLSSWDARDHASRRWSLDPIVPSAVVSRLLYSPAIFPTPRRKFSLAKERRRLTSGALGHASSLSRPAFEKRAREQTHAMTREPPRFNVRAVRRSRETRGHWLRENLPSPPDECADRQCGVVVGGLRGVARKGWFAGATERKRERESDGDGASGRKGDRDTR